jgi:small conductance mechanosensitive channel
MDPTNGEFAFIWAAAWDWGVKCLIALVIWFIGTTIAKVVSNAVRRLLLRYDGVDPSVANFAARAVNVVGLIIIAVLVLNLFGINTTSIAAMLGAMTLAIGLALRETLANVAAGIMILVTRPFLTGHYIDIGGDAGTVRAINLFNTELASLDNVQIIVPNKQIWDSTLKNYSAHERRRLDMVIGVDYGADLDQAVAIMTRLIDADPRALRDPEPFVKVTELGQSAVDITLRVWCRAEDLFDMKFDLTKKIKERFDQAGISIPYPHIELVHKEPARPGGGFSARSPGASQHH